MSTNNPQQYGQNQPQPSAMPGQAMGQPYEHPQTQTVMILALVGLLIGICEPIAWYIGSKAKKEMIAQGMEPTDKLKLWTMVAMILTIIYIVGFVFWTGFSMLTLSTLATQL